MAAYFCDHCGEPNTGNVNEDVCVDCLMGIEGRDGRYCKFCEVPIDSGDAGYEQFTCDDCQVELDIPSLDEEYHERDDETLCTQQDEEYLRGPTF